MWTPRFSPIPRMPSYLRVPTSRTGSRPIERQVKLWSEDVRRPPDVLLRHTHLNGTAGMSWFIHYTYIYEELHAWKELRGKPKSKPWALALEINYESSDSKNMGVEFRLVTRKRGWAAQMSPTVPTQTEYVLLLDQKSFSCPHSALRESQGMPPMWWAMGHSRALGKTPGSIWT